MHTAPGDVQGALDGEDSCGVVTLDAGSLAVHDRPKVDTVSIQVCGCPPVCGAAGAEA